MIASRQSRDLAQAVIDMDEWAERLYETASIEKAGNATFAGVWVDTIVQFVRVHGKKYTTFDIMHAAIIVAEHYHEQVKEDRRKQSSLLFAAG